jgi:hypothetical protein
LSRTIFLLLHSKCIPVNTLPINSELFSAIPVISRRFFLSQLGAFCPERKEVIGLDSNQHAQILLLRLFSCHLREIGIFPDSLIRIPSHARVQVPHYWCQWHTGESLRTIFTSRSGYKFYAVTCELGRSRERTKNKSDTSARGTFNRGTSFDVETSVCERDSSISGVPL